MAARTYYPRCRVILDVLLEDFGDGTTGESHTYEVVPRSASWTRNDLRTADEFTLELDYRDFPLDPRTVRAVSVAIYAGDVVDPSAQLDKDNEDTQVFVGLVDEPETALSGDQEVVRLSGRDQTALFLGEPWRWGAIDITRPLSTILSEIIAAVPVAEGFTVEVDASASDAVLSEWLGKDLWTYTGGDDVWTVMVALCAVAGLVPVVDRDVLRVLSPATMTAQTVGFLYGSNVSSLGFRRRLSEERTKRVQLTAWDPSTRTSTQVLYPTDPTVSRRRIAANGKVITDTESVIAWTVIGAYTDDQLTALAESYYEESARPEVQGTLETKDLTDLDSSYPLGLVANGDLLTVQLGTTCADIAGLSRFEAVDLLTGGPLPLDQAAAEALVDAWTSAQSLTATFRARKALHTWSRDSGYKLSVDFETYIGAAT